MAMSRDREIQTIAVVGASTGEGKTTTSANLAAALAQADKKVLVVSADFRKPRLHDFFHLPNEPGMTNFLLGDVPFEDAVHHYGPDLYVMTSGPIAARPAELLLSGGMAEFISMVTRRFDYVIVDTPPVLGLADTLAIAPLVDVIVLVAHAESTKRKAVAHAANQLQRVGAGVTVSVLTNVVQRRLAPDQYGTDMGMDMDMVYRSLGRWNPDSESDWGDARRPRRTPPRRLPNVVALPPGRATPRSTRRTPIRF